MKSKNDELVWKEFANENNGKYIIGKYDNSDSVEIDYLSYKILFDNYTRYQVVGSGTYVSNFTRVRIELKTPQELRFRLSNEELFDYLTKIFGAQDIKIGDKDFDRKFILKGNNESLIQLIFSSKNLKNKLIKQDDLIIQLLDKEGIFDEPIKEGNAMLYYISENLINEKEQLDSLLLLFQSLIDQLIKTNSIKSI
jgi:hypothetical protein